MIKIPHDHDYFLNRQCWIELTYEIYSNIFNRYHEANPPKLDGVVYRSDEYLSCDQDSGDGDEDDD